MSNSIYQAAAELHAVNINQGFLASLGVKFLSLMYRAIDESSDSVLIVVRESGDVVGFIAGGKGMGAIYKRLLRHPVELFLSLLPALISPMRMWRIFEILRYSGGGNPVLEKLPHAELLSIVVDPRFRGKGYAESLYRQLEDYFSSQGENSFKIIVGGGLQPAHRFYQRMGARAAAEIEVHKGGLSTIYVQSLSLNKSDRA